VYAADSVDVGAAKRTLIQGLDQNGLVIYSQDGSQEVTGEFLTVDTPFQTSVNLFSQLTGIQKDQTSGDIKYFQVDPTTGDETLLLTMQPSETVAGYRRYYLNNLPANCCATSGTAQNLTITAIAKMEMIPVIVDTDYLLLQNIEALIEESISIRMSEMDSMNAQQLAAVHHKNAILHLLGELKHYLGVLDPAISFKPFGSASLERLNVAMI
jgi:hypothetical protein